MLQDFIDVHRTAIISRTREMVAARPWPLPSTPALEYGVHIFLTQVADTLRRDTSGLISEDVIGPSARRRGAELFEGGFTLSQVVHNYGDVCQAITALAVARHAPITTEEFHILNRCLDTAIAESVTEHGRIGSKIRVAEEVERLGVLAHEIRDLLNTGLMALDIVKRGTVPINGSTGAVLARSLAGIQHVVQATLTDVRLSANQQRREHVRIISFLDEIAVSARMNADHRGQHFAIDEVDPELTLDADPQLLGSAVRNLLNNASKFTPPGGRITLRAQRQDVCVRIEIADQCGGIPEQDDMFKPFSERRGRDKTGLGLGLAIARRAVRAHGGDISVRNLPREGCVFTIEIPLAAGPGGVQASS